MALGFNLTLKNIRNVELISNFENFNNSQFCYQLYSWRATDSSNYPSLSKPMLFVKTCYQNLPVYFGSPLKALSAKCVISSNELILILIKFSSFIKNDFKLVALIGPLIDKKIKKKNDQKNR